MVNRIQAIQMKIPRRRQLKLPLKSDKREAEQHQMPVLRSHRSNQRRTTKRPLSQRKQQQYPVMIQMMIPPRKKLQRKELRPQLNQSKVLSRRNQLPRSQSPSPTVMKTAVMIQRMKSRFNPKQYKQ